MVLYFGRLSYSCGMYWKWGWERKVLSFWCCVKAEKCRLYVYLNWKGVCCVDVWCVRMGVASAGTKTHRHVHVCFRWTFQRKTVSHSRFWFRIYIWIFRNAFGWRILPVQINLIYDQNSEIGQMFSSQVTQFLDEEKRSAVVLYGVGKRVSTIFISQYFTSWAPRVNLWWDSRPVRIPRPVRPKSTFQVCPKIFHILVLKFC